EEQARGSLETIKRETTHQFSLRCSDHTTFDTRESQHTWRYGKQRPRHHLPRTPVWQTALKPVRPKPRPPLWLRQPREKPRPPEWPRQHQL
ncbi:unnamed protein product, partial [Pylaiella littoralis]